MSHRKDWIPTKNKDFKEFSDTFCTAAKANQFTWFLITNNVKALLALQVNYLKYYAVTAITKGFTGLDTANTQNAKDLLLAAIRAMGINEMKHNSKMTDENRDSVGVHNDADTHTASPIETSSPVIQTNNQGSLGMGLRYSPAGTHKSSALPDGQMAIILKFGFYKKGDTVPSEDKCTQMEIIGRSPAFVTFLAENFGMLFVGYARYLNTRKQLGLVATTFNGVVV